MIYACDACRYIFETEEKITQCPDCGKFEIRAATEDEISEYKDRLLETDDWDDGRLFGGSQSTGDSE